MFQTFSGSSRRPRQVNLSGRTKPNPWATTGSGSTTSSNASPSGGSGTHNALLSAQQEREKRLRERQRLAAARTLQRWWRGVRDRGVLKDGWRREWDGREQGKGGYNNDEEARAQAALLLRFANARGEDDGRRVRTFLQRLAASTREARGFAEGKQWEAILQRLQTLLIAVVDARVATVLEKEEDAVLLQGLDFTLQKSPIGAQQARLLYTVLSRLLRSASASAGSSNAQNVQTLVQCLITPLQTISPSTSAAYEALAQKVFTIPELSSEPLRSSCLGPLAAKINYKLLANALAETLAAPDSHGYEELRDEKSRAYLLAYLIFCYRTTHQYAGRNVTTNDTEYMQAVSALLSSVAADSSRKKSRSEFDDEETDGLDVSLVENDSFVQEQVLSLVDSETIASLLGGGQQEGNKLMNMGSMDADAKQLASFTLTLLRFFPRKGDEIRIRLYRGSAISSNINSLGERIPAIKYFWHAARNTEVFRSITRQLDSAVPLIKPQRHRSTSGFGSSSSRQSREEVQDDWRIILVFFELYTFVLRLMDDEEFFYPSRSGKVVEQASNWASQNALPLEDVQELTVFLKNLGFAMYFNAQALSDVEATKPRDVGSISGYFNVSSFGQSETIVPKDRVLESTVAGIPGVAIDYVKGIVTGLLRMLYERDSRRPFLPKGHWLMTSRLDMDGFISSVVEEDENRHRIQEEDIEDRSGDENDDMEDERQNVIGAGYTSRIRQQQRLQLQQRRYARRRHLQAVAPRLEILQNMPFFIPFETRVQIFREFVKLDKFKRRGTEDADHWRFANLHNPDLMKRHHATIRRGHVFEDAFDQFYTLGDGLKEPIQITFEDAFGNEEAGIDGGGVTKEFLTSITKEAFGVVSGLHLFAENEQHLLYPNPAVLDELSASTPQGPDHHERLRKATVQLLDKMDFLGRVIGKCMYEGILVDVNFAGFFLLKWALTGGEGMATRESSYRANLNDLRELDEGLYQGLLQLKNYPGDVADFSLDFTIGDTVVTDAATGATKVITRPLKPGGDRIPVTNENRLVYISYVARHRLQIQPHRQTSSFLRGLSSMIQPGWLNMFNQSELQTLVGGSSSSIDIADMRSHTEYGGVYVLGDDGREHDTVALFWRVMTSLADDQRRAVLKFVTSTPRAPLLGFASLTPRFSIRDSGNDQTRLPSTSTCVNLLKLPMYRSESVLREKLLLAVNSGAGFDLS